MGILKMDLLTVGLSRWVGLFAASSLTLGAIFAGLGVA